MVKERIFEANRFNEADFFTKETSEIKTTKIVLKKTR